MLKKSGRFGAIAGVIAASFMGGIYVEKKALFRRASAATANVRCIPLKFATSTLLSLSAENLSVYNFKF